MPEILRREALYWKHAWRAAPGRLVVAWTLVLGIAASTFASIHATARLVGALERGAPAAELHRWLLLAVLAFALTPVLSALLQWAGASHQAAMTTDQLHRLGALADAPHGIAHLEDSERAGALTADLRSQFGLTATQMSWISLGIRAQGIAALAVLVQWSPWAALALLAGQLLLGQLFTRYVQIVQADLIEAESTERRHAGYLHGLLLDRSAGKEVRLFGLTDHLLAGHARIWRDAQQGVESRRNAAMWPALLGSLVTLATIGGTVAWVARQAWVGAADAQTVMAIIMALVGIVSLGPLGDLSAASARARLYAGRLEELETTAGEAAPRAARRPAAGAAAVHLDRVSFTYPGASAPTLRELSLEIPAGQSLAIVGVNGVGKSTLLKLLTGLHRPDAGTVRIDETDPGTDDAARQRVAVIFQDFARYHLSLRENVLLGAPTAREAGGEQADAAVGRALEAAASTALLDRIGSPDTPLDPGYEGGTDLSGGQWQRVALARALAAVEEGAGVLVLDEPTAALDVRVEAELFEQLLRAAGHLTTILVSHRLSSVRRAERIVVLGPEGIVEDGSHDELLAAGGEYARMFTLQASRFAGGAPASEETPDAH
ncbi:ABC transporter [Kytococcus aerolatus]|uniref:ABC transporter n=1 Tax=Kytococcus aerolatus TaxID=592308 RepID=A0A212TZI6_9MICO|nr:ABC transporter ATP-binding protein [Kytococcus aerolatus]SNC71413.1 ABC transporter [Kytococcus aerolatus]